MRTVRDLLDHKHSGGETLAVWTIQPYASVYDAIESMADRDVGALVVTDGDKPVGIITERDYARKGILRRRFALDTLVADIMRNPVVSVGPDAALTHCMQLMVDEGVRHLPVVEEGRLTGMVSMGDVLKWVLAEEASADDDSEDTAAANWRARLAR